MDLVLKAVGYRDMREQFADAARVGGVPEIIFIFRDILGDRQRILAHGAQTVGQLLCSVIIQVESPLVESQINVFAIRNLRTSLPRPARVIEWERRERST